MTTTINPESSSTTSKTRALVAGAASGSKSRKSIVSEKHGKIDFDAVNKLARKAACELKIESKDPVAGTLYKVKSGVQLLHLFISTNKRLPANSPDDLTNAQLLLRDRSIKDECINMSFADDKVRHAWNTRPREEHSGNTVVVLSDKVVTDCLSGGANFLNIGEAHPGEEVFVWFWWPNSAETPLILFKPRALIESVSSEGLTILLDDIPEPVRDKWGERGSLLLLQLFGGASAIFINKRGEAVAMDTILNIDYSAEVDKNFADSCGIDTNKHTYPFKVKVIPLSLLINRNCEQPLVDAAPLKLPKEPKELSEKEFECAVCKEPAVNAVNCVKCQNILCESHLSQLSKCPYCKSEPFETQPNKFVRRLISKLEVPCPQCGAPITRGDLSAHQKKFCPKREGAELRGAKDSQKTDSSVSTASGSTTTGDQPVENAVDATGKDVSSQLEGISKAKPRDWKSQRRKLSELISKLKFVQANEFNFLIDLLGLSNAYFQQTYDESDQQVPPLELIEYINLILNALTDALAQLRSSPDSEHVVSEEQEAVSSDAAAFNLSVDTLKAKCQRAEEMISSLQYLLQRLLMNGDDFSVEVGSNESGLSSEVVQMTRTLFRDLAEIFNGGKNECNRAMVISEMTDRLEEFLQNFTPVLLRQTREFKNVLATLEHKRTQTSSSNNIVATPTKELIRQELESFSDIQRALTKMDVLLTHASSKNSSPLTISLTSPTGFALTTGIHEECQRAIINITLLIFQLNSTVCQKLPQLRSGLGDTNTEDLEHTLLQMVLELRGKLDKFSLHVGKNCTSKQFLNEMADAIFDCYNSIPDKVFKCVSFVMVERENQKYDLNRRLLIDQQERTRQEKLVQERNTEIAKVKQQFDGVRNQLKNVKKQKTVQENLVLERDTEIGEIRHQLETVQNQLNDVQHRRTLQENLVRERDTEIGEIRHQLETVQNQLNDVLQQHEPSLLSDSSNDVTLETATVQQPNGLFANANPIQDNNGIAISLLYNNLRYSENEYL